MEAVVLRALHVLAAAVLVGMPIGMAIRGGDPRRAEWIFWSSAGVLVLGGVANLGALGAVPPLSSRRGLVLAGKILLVLGLLVISMARLGRSAQERPAPRLWAATGILAAVALVLAVVLAHG